MIVSMIVLISCSVHDNGDGKTNENFGVIKKISLILEYGRDSVERPSLEFRGSHFVFKVFQGDQPLSNLPNMLLHK